MKPKYFLIVAAIVLFSGLKALPQASSADSLQILGIFVGTTPCASVVKPILRIPAADSCDEITWTLTFYVNKKTKQPGNYTLMREFRYYIDNRTTQSKGLAKTQGKWIFSKGAKTDPNAIVFQLSADDPGISLRLIKLDENLIHPLAKDGSLLVGNGGQSFTLSRTNINIK